MTSQKALDALADVALGSDDSGEAFLLGYERGESEALELTDQELAIMEAAYDESIEEYEGDGLGAMNIGLKAVAKYRAGEYW